MQPEGSDHSFNLLSLSLRLATILLPVVLGAYLLITSTTQLSDNLWQFDAKRMVQLYLLPALFLWVLVIPRLRGAFTLQAARIPRWMGIALFLMFVLGIISAWFNSTSHMGLAYSLADVALLFLLVVAVICIAACRQLAGELFDRVIIVMIAMVGVAVGLQELIGVLAAWNSGMAFNPGIALANFAWPRFYNQVQSWTLPLIAALPFIFPRKGTAWLLCMMALALHWYVVLATGGRGTMVAVSSAVIFAAVFWPVARKQFVFTHVAGLLMGVLIYALVVAGHGQIQESDPAAPPASATQPQAESPTTKPVTDESGEFTSTLTGKRMSTSSGRTAMWRGSLKDTQAHPWLGIGPMNYACKGPVFRAAHPHSFPMQFVSEWGIPAFILLLITGGFVAFRLITTVRAESKGAQNVAYLHAALATGLIAAAIHACLSGVLIMPASQVTGILVCGWLLGSFPVAGKPSTGLVSRSLLLIALAIAMVFLWFAARQVNSNIQRYEDMDNPGLQLPRFWQYGKDCRLDLTIQEALLTSKEMR